MARLGQQYLPLDWQAVEEAPDLDRLRLVLEDLPDEGLMRRLESRRWGERAGEVELPVGAASARPPADERALAGTAA